MTLPVNESPPRARYSFAWSPTFETGIDHVDSQHRFLVDAVNEFGALLVADEISFAAIRELLAKMADYAVFHFTTEEEMMRKAGIDPAHLSHHVEEHSRFIDEVNRLGGALRPDLPEVGSTFLEFLVDWLSYHILDTDQRMARQLEAIRGGTDPATAFRQSEQWPEVVQRPLTEALHGLFHTVSDRNQELRRYEGMIAGASDMLALVGTDFRIAVANQAYAARFGLTSREVIGRPLRAVLGAGLFDEVVRPRAERCLEGEIVRYQEWFDYPQAGRRFMDVVYHPYRETDGSISGLVVSKRDFTETRLAEDERERLLFELTERVKELNCLYTVNRILQQRLDLESMITQVLEAIPSGWQHPAITRAHIDLDGVGYPGSRQPESSFRLRAPIRVAGVERGMLEVAYCDPPADPGQPFLDEERQLIENIAAALGEALEVAESGLQRELAESRLRQAQKMDAAGQLASGVAHDFNNILAIALGNLRALQRTVPENGAVRTRIEKAVASIERGSRLARRLLDFSRRESRNPAVIDVNGLLLGAKDLVDEAVKPKVSTRYELADDLWPVQVDARELEEVLINLAINARDAMPTGGSLTVATCNRTTRLRRAGIALPEGDYVSISLTDTGVGMTPDIVEHVFEPFFTTKTEGRGTGLGLSMAYGFIERSHGEIRIRTEPDRGTTMELLLPRSRDAATTSILDPREPVPSSIPMSDPARAETVLVVDDEADLRDLIVEYLQGLGYVTLSASCAEEALALIREHPDIDVLLSDILMPGGMDGVALANNARDLSPRIRILLASGYVDEDLRERLSAIQVGDVLQKPFDEEDLARRIRSLLDRERPETAPQ